MAAKDATSKRFAFIFPMASGHINPSLPIARSLVQLGHKVHFQCREQMRLAIEDTGATFYDEVGNLTEMYEGREPDLFGALESLKKEFGLEGDNMIVVFRKLMPIILEKMLPGTLRFLQRVQPDAVVCCPLMNKETVQAAKILGIPCVGLLTTAGPGSMAKAMNEFVTMSGLTAEEIDEAARNFAPNIESRARFEATYGYSLRPDDGFKPMGVLQAVTDSTLTLVTTCKDLQDSTTPEMDEAYANVTFESVGPLLDVAGAVRAAGHKFKVHEEEAKVPELSEVSPLARMQAARAAGRKVILVSMGTVITGDSDDFGWHVKPREGAKGERKGLTGRELCQSAWAGAFDAFGAYGPVAESAAAPLVLVALGPQTEALGDLQVPDNALCMPILPQVDILKAGVDLFLTHGGQNSFTESLSEGVPMVVCPGFGDQPVNARKAVHLGVGLQVERPSPTDGTEAQACQAYRRCVAAALRQVDSEPRFAAAASFMSRRLKAAGGVPRAVKLILGVSKPAAAPRLPTLLTTGREADAEKKSAPAAAPAGEVQAAA